MFDLNSLDYVYIGAVLASTVWATIRGGVYETVATASWLIAALTARFMSPYLDHTFQGWFGLSESTIGTLVASYFIVFVVILLLFLLFNQKLRDRVQQSMLKVTDHTLGVIFGIIRGIVLMGLFYWGALWYYSDTPLPDYISKSRTRPVMQLTAKKIDDWFLPGKSRLLTRDIKGENDKRDAYENLINPAIKPSEQARIIASAGNTGNAKTAAGNENPESAPVAKDTGYKSSERSALENQLMQIESTAILDNQEQQEQQQNPPVRPQVQ